MVRFSTQYNLFSDFFSRNFFSSLDCEVDMPRRAAWPWSLPPFNSSIRWLYFEWDATASEAFFEKTSKNLWYFSGTTVLESVGGFSFLFNWHSGVRLRLRVCRILLPLLRSVKAWNRNHLRTPYPQQEVIPQNLWKNDDQYGFRSSQHPIKAARQPPPYLLLADGKLHLLLHCNFQLMAYLICISCSHSKGLSGLELSREVWQWWWQLGNVRSLRVSWNYFPRCGWSQIVGARYFERLANAALRM